MDINNADKQPIPAGSSSPAGPVTPGAAVTRLGIEGMHCAACVSRLEKVLARQPGVIRASVNLATESALVEHDLAWQAEPSLQAVEKAGFQASLVVPGQTAASGGDQSDADGIGLTSVLLSLAGALLLMGPMMTGLPHWPTWFQCVVATPIQFVAGRVFLVGAFKALRAGAANMDVLVALGSLTAWVYSMVVWFSGAGVDEHSALLFEASASVIAFVLLGKWLERRTRRRTAQAIVGLGNLRPDRVDRVLGGSAQTFDINADHGKNSGDISTTGLSDHPLQFESVPLDFVCVGDHIRSAPGSRIPCDAVVLRGQSHVDESALTGEPVANAKRPGDTVHAGALNLDGELLLQVTHTGGATLLGQVITLIEKAQGQKLPAQALADRIASVFVPVVIVVAALIGIGLLWGGAGLELALVRAVTVVVVACPCALGLATPAAIMAGTGAAARAGILVRDPRALATATRIDTLIFDKTGTLTVGRPVLTEMRCPDALSGEDPECLSMLQLAAGLQSRGAHPLGDAILDALQTKRVTAAPLSDVRLLPGVGMEGVWGSQSRIVLCNPAHATDLVAREAASITGQLAELIEAVGHSGQTVSVLLGMPLREDNSIDDAPAIQQGQEEPLRSSMSHVSGLRLLAVFAFTDALRPQATEVVAYFQRMGIALVVASGDRPEAVSAVAGHLGITDWQGGCSPADKALRIRALQSDGRCVAMVGDGVNDAPAMALADLSMAMGGGTDIAAQTAHMTLMGGDLRAVAWAIDIARRMHRNIAENLFWAFAYNIVCIPLAALGSFSPAVAAAAMALSSVSVVANALRLTAWRPDGRAGR